jgi:hypothetical protein
MFQSKNSVLGSSCFANLFQTLAMALSVACFFNSLFSLAHHLVLSLCLEFITTFFDTPFATKKSHTVSISDSMYSFFNQFQSRFLIGIKFS